MKENCYITFTNLIRNCIKIYLRQSYRWEHGQIIIMCHTILQYLGLILIVIFSKNVTVGTPIIQVKAEDADNGLNGEVHYRLKQDLAGHWRTFQIDDKTGVITTKLALDRETQRLYEVGISMPNITSHR